MWRYTLRALAVLLFLGCGSCYTERGSGDTSVAFPWDSCSYEIGGTACNFSLRDQDNNVVDLYDYYGKTIVLDFSAMWCGPCGMAASEVQAVKDSLADKNFVYITILIEDYGGSAPDLGDCKNWSETYSISEPVLAGDRSLMARSGEAGWQVTSWPTFFFITEDMVIHSTLKGFSSSYIDMMILEAMGQSE